MIASLVGAAIFAAVAIAAATPVTPPPGTTVITAHLDFTWTLPANEQSAAILIADKPDVTAEGKFYRENWVDGGNVAADVREWCLRCRCTPVTIGGTSWQPTETPARARTACLQSSRFQRARALPRDR